MNSVLVMILEVLTLVCMTLILMFLRVPSTCTRSGTPSDAWSWRPAQWRSFIFFWWTWWGSKIYHDKVDFNFILKKIIISDGKETPANSLFLPVLRPRLGAHRAVGGADGLVLRLDDPPVDAASRLPDRNVVLAYSVEIIYISRVFPRNNSKFKLYFQLILTKDLSKCQCIWLKL